jgi:nucleoside-diphosphate-sugar epimerase
MTAAQRRILITGASGGLGQLMRPRLRRPGRALRLLDVVAPAPAEPGEAVEPITASVTDAEAMAEACAGVDAIIHLGGHSRETAWADAMQVNIDGTHTLLEAARHAGVGRVILASSNHAVGFREIAEAADGPLPADSSPRPDTYYGVSKAAIEALGSLYHFRFGIDVIAVRIGSCFETPLPLGPRGLITWLSPDDGARLFEACLAYQSPGYRLIWGVSDNTRRICSLAEAEALGYKSLDNAERFADQLLAGDGAEALKFPYLGGAAFCEAPLGAPNPM